MTKVEISGIGKAYTRGLPVLEDISLEIAPGELFFLLGPSGCGKSTLLRIISGLTAADRGSISFNGRRIDALPPEKRRCAMVFQNYALWPHLNVFDNVAFALRASGTPKERVAAAVASALETVQLSEVAGRKVPSLSGGQQQRVALARALAAEPELLLLDEPLSNLDARLRDTMRREIRRICKERKLTAVYVTHDRQEALSMGDRIAVMQSGSIRQVGTPEELYFAPRRKFVAAFMGDGNFIELTAESEGRWQSRFGEIHMQFEAAPGSRVWAMIRPEQIAFAGRPGENVIEVTAVSRTFLGESVLWECRAAGGEIFSVKEMGDSSRRLDAVKYLHLPQAHIVPLRDEPGDV